MQKMENLKKAIIRHFIPNSDFDFNDNLAVDNVVCETLKIHLTEENIEDIFALLPEDEVVKFGPKEAKIRAINDLAAEVGAKSFQRFHGKNATFILGDKGIEGKIPNEDLTPAWVPVSSIMEIEECSGPGHFIKITTATGKYFTTNEVVPFFQVRELATDIMNSQM